MQVHHVRRFLRLAVLGVLFKPGIMSGIIDIYTMHVQTGGMYRIGQGHLHKPTWAGVSSRVALSMNGRAALLDGV